MQHKILLLASFVDKNDIHKFLFNLKESYNVEPDKVFIFELSDKDYLLTYKIKVEVGNKFNIKKELPKTIQIHKKQKTFFTINALNKLIERDCDLESGNVNHKKFTVDWSNYEDTIILIKKDNLEITNISRVFLSN
tara:strand:+ start:5411 stop:5818 length:408 start_codon:yes stop_codon:yes gene_type:complete